MTMEETKDEARSIKGERICSTQEFKTNLRKIARRKTVSAVPTLNSQPTQGTATELSPPPDYDSGLAISQESHRAQAQQGLLICHIPATYLAPLKALEAKLNNTPIPLSPWNSLFSGSVINLTERN